MCIYIVVMEMYKDIFILITIGKVKFRLLSSKFFIKLKIQYCSICTGISAVKEGICYEVGGMEEILSEDHFFK